MPTAEGGNSMAKNSYAAKLQAKKEANWQLAYNQGWTYAMVIAIITMHDVLGIGAQRLERFCDEFSRTRDQVQEMMDIDPAYAETVLQRKLEQMLPNTEVVLRICEKMI